MNYLIYKMIYGISLRKIIGYMVILLLIWKKLGNYIQKNPDIKKVWKLSNSLIAIGAIGMIGVATLSARSGSGTELILTPFHSFREARTQPELYRSMLMNVFLFFPMGLTLPYALPEKWSRKGLLTILFAMFFSIGIEIAQYHFRLGRAETDDVICNTLGCVIGTLSYYMSKIKKN